MVLIEETFRRPKGISSTLNEPSDAKDIMDHVKVDNPKIATYDLIEARLSDSNGYPEGLFTSYIYLFFLRGA